MSERRPPYLYEPGAELTIAGLPGGPTRVRVLARRSPNDPRYGRAIYDVEEVATGARYPVAEDRARP